MTRNSAALATTGHRPAHLPQATRTANQRTLLRPQHQRYLELTIRLVIEMPSERGRENWRLDEPHRIR
jgi:hypothetical protein